MAWHVTLNSRKSVRWSAVSLPCRCLRKLWFELQEEQGSGPERANYPCFGFWVLGPNAGIRVSGLDFFLEDRIWLNFAKVCKIWQSLAEFGRLGQNLGLDGQEGGTKEKKKKEKFPNVWKHGQSAAAQNGWIFFLHLHFLTIRYLLTRLSFSLSERVRF